MFTSRLVTFSFIATLASISFLSGMHVSAIGKQFSDVPNSHWAKEAIEYVSAEGLMNGVNDSEFSPDTAVTRAQLAMVLHRMSLSTSYVDIDRALHFAHNAQRRTHVNVILNAIYQYAIDNNGQYPFQFNSTKSLEICKSGARCPKTMIDLSELANLYLDSIPVDPEATDSISTGYTIFVDKQGRITVAAPLSKTEEISVTR
jgi:S-layer homology domain